MSSETYTNKISKLSYNIKETDEKAIATITFEVSFPFKYLAEKLSLILMNYHFDVKKVSDKYHDTPHPEIAKMLLDLKQREKALKE